MRSKFLTILLFASTMSPVPAEWFRHRSTPENVNSNYTLLAPHLTSARSDRFFVQPLRRGFSSEHPNLSLGLWYPAALQRWSIFYEKNSESMGFGLEYAVYRAEEDDTTFVHRHLHAEQGVEAVSYLDHPSLNGKPGVFPFVTQNWDAAGGVYQDKFIPLLAYNGTREQWYILVNDVDTFSEFPTIPNGAAWNVLVKESGPQTFRAITPAIVSSFVLDHPLLDNNPYALFLVSIEHHGNLSRSRIVSVYDEGAGRWTLRNLSGGNFRAGLRFLITLTGESDVPPPAVEITSVAPQNFLKFPTEFGFRYQLETSLDLKDWFSEGLSFLGNGETRTYPTTAVLPATNYRLKRVLE